MQSTKVDELHIFDFDGTIFRTPIPHPARLTKDDPKFLEKVKTVPPYGLGWFQHPASLQPPFVPTTPGPEWYVSDIVQTAQQLTTTTTNDDKGKKETPPSRYVVVMTGRDEYFRKRVTELVKLAGIEADEIILKPGPKFGTMKYKMQNIYRLLESTAPCRVIMYEDREEHARDFTAELRICQSMIQTGRQQPSHAEEKAMQRSGGRSTQRFPRLRVEKMYKLAEEQQQQQQKDSRPLLLGNVDIVMVPSQQSTNFLSAEQEIQYIEVLKAANWDEIFQ